MLCKYVVGRCIYDRKTKSYGWTPESMEEIEHAEAQLRARDIAWAPLNDSDPED